MQGYADDEAGYEETLAGEAAGPRGGGRRDEGGGGRGGGEVSGGGVVSGAVGPRWVAAESGEVAAAGVAAGPAADASGIRQG